MADDAARPSETDPASAAGSPRCSATSARRPRPASARAASARRRSNSCGPIRAILDGTSTRPNSTNSPPRSRSAASFSRFWRAPFRASPTPMRSSPASGAGAPRSAPACTRSRSSSSKRATARRSKSPSSRMSSAPTSTPLKKRAAMRSSAADYGYSHNDIARIIGKSRSHIANTLRLPKLPEFAAVPARFRADFGGTRARAARRRRSRRHRRANPHARA